MQLLDWLVVATVAAIVLVLLDGLRRKWVERRDRVVMKLDRNIPQEDIDLDLLPNSELPNGGARTLPRESDPFPPPRKRTSRLKDGRDQTRRDNRPAVESVPVLMDPVEVEEETIEHANVFVRAEEIVVSDADAFSDDELPPEVLAGLDAEFEEDQAAKSREQDEEDDDELAQDAEEELYAFDAESRHEELDDDYDGADDDLDDDLDADDEFDDDIDEDGDEDIDEEQDDEIDDDLDYEPDDDLDDEGLDEDIDDDFDEELEEGMTAVRGDDDFDEEFDDAEELEEIEEEVEEEAEEEAEEEFEEEAEEEAELAFTQPLEDEEEEHFEFVLEEEFTETAGGDYEPVADDDEQAGEDSELPEEDDEYPQEEYDDEYDYENEPTLLEGAYRKAASHFQRPPVVETPRMEPGFGEVPAAEELEPAEDFSTAFNEELMEEILDQEQAEIRAWRAQSVTQQAAPEPVPEKGRGKRGSTDDTPPVRPIFVAAADEASVDIPESSAAEPAPPPPATKSRGKAKEKPAKQPKKGFWEAVTGKAATTKQAVAKVNQGELFEEEEPAEEVAPASDPGPQEVIIINVMAKAGQYFRGDELLPLVQRYGMRLGDMSIFHRHADQSGLGPVMFSMANMVKPGTFSLSNMDEFVTPGVSFFVQLPNKFGNMKSFEQMLATAEGIKQALDGDLKDERRSVFTRQTVEHCRQRIRDFELSVLARK